MMPPPTASLKPSSNGTKPTDSSAKIEAAAAPSNGSSSVDKSGQPRLTKPDQAAYNAQMDELNKEIEGVKAELNDVRSKLSLLHAPTAGSNDRRTQIRAEMDALMGTHNESRSERQKTLDQVKRLQESVQLKIKDVQAQRSKLPYRNSEEADARIAQLERQVESGTLKLIDEKKALQEITQIKRSRTQLGSLGGVEESIAADRQRIEALRAQLDAPEAKAKQARYEELKKQLDEVKKQGNEAYEQRSGLFDKRTALSQKMDELYGRKRELSSAHRSANDAYYARVQAERQAKQDRFRAQKAEEDAARKREEVEQMREEAQAPAYSREIEDCGLLIAWFQGKTGGKVPETHAGAASAASSSSLDGVKKLEIRKVEDAPPTGMLLKKKAADEDVFFAGSGGKRKGNKGGNKQQQSSGTSTPVAAGESSSSSSSTAINLPMGLLTALLSLGISPPTGKDDTTRVVGDLEHKRDWFVANQERKTKEEIERVERLVEQLEKQGKLGAGGEGDEEVEGAKEPVHTVDAPGSADQDASLAPPPGKDHSLSPSPDASQSAEKQVDALDDKIEQAKKEDGVEAA